MENMFWPAITPIVTERLRLDVLTAEHAAPMVGVLAPSALYEYTGGQAPTLPELHTRYGLQSACHSPDQSQWWLNWVVVLSSTGRPIGFVQATVEQASVGLEANLAWVITPTLQGRGLATEAAQAMVDWLGTHGVVHLVADIHPAHAASQGVARRVGLQATAVIVDAEVPWRSEGAVHAHL